MRNFEQWLSTFKHTISNYKYFTDFNKVYANVNKYKIELNILNSLIGSNDIEKDFEKILNQYPKTIKCIPLLLAIRQYELYIRDNNTEILYNFKNKINDINQYKVFMRETGLFDLISNHLINNLVDYVTGIETGLDSNGRKNRGGHLMEDLVENYIRKTNVEYYKEMKTNIIEQKWGIDLSSISNNGKNRKKFDFVVRNKNKVYAIETNFYTSGGSKLNETARSYKMIALESKNISDFVFVWVTDGIGWISARNNLRETFDVLETIYNINDLENGAFNKLFKN